MKLSEANKQVITLFALKFPIIPGEDNCRVWTHKLCEQLAHSFPKEGWSHKGVPHSKDAIARYPLVWDVILNSGTPSPVLNVDADSQDMTGQPIEPVTPTNWLADDTPPPPPPPPPPVETCPCAEKLDAILAELILQRKAVEKVAADIPAAIAGGIKIRF